MCKSKNGVIRRIGGNRIGRIRRLSSDSASASVSYDLVKTGKTEAQAEESANHRAHSQSLVLLGKQGSLLDGGRKVG